MTKKLQLLLLLSLGFFSISKGGGEVSRLATAIQNLHKLEQLDKDNERLKKKLYSYDSYDLREDSGKFKENISDLKALQTLVQSAALKRKDGSDLGVSFKKGIESLDGTFNVKAIFEVASKPSAEDEEPRIEREEMMLKFHSENLKDLTGSDSLSLGDLQTQAGIFLDSIYSFDGVKEQYKRLQCEKKNLDAQFSFLSKELGEPGSFFRSWNDNKWHCKGLAFGLGTFLATYAAMSNPEQEEVKVNPDGSTKVSKKMSLRQKYLAAVGSTLAIVAALSSKVGRAAFFGTLNYAERTKDALTPNICVKPVLDHNCLELMDRYKSDRRELLPVDEFQGKF